MVSKTIKKEIKLFLNQNFIAILLNSETHFTTKYYFSIPRYKFTTPIFLMAQRTELLRYL